MRRLDTTEGLATDAVETNDTLSGGNGRSILDGKGFGSELASTLRFGTIEPGGTHLSGGFGTPSREQLAANFWLEHFLEHHDSPFSELYSKEVLSYLMSNLRESKKCQVLEGMLERALQVKGRVIDEETSTLVCTVLGEAAVAQYLIDKCATDSDYPLDTGDLMFMRRVLGQSACDQLKERAPIVYYRVTTACAHEFTMDAK